VISDNTIQGVGPNITTGYDSGMRGVSIGQGATGSVVGNTVGGFSYVDDGVNTPNFPYAWGIIAADGASGGFVPLEFIRFENNILRDNNLHMVLAMGHGNEVVNNRFEGTAPSERMAGLWFSGENVLVQGNQFWEMEAGIRAAGTDPVDLGLAENAVLIENRFCEVGVPIELQEGSSVTETGSLICPFPNAVIGIVKAAQLSWPDYYGEDYVLEGGPTRAGPWAKVMADLERVDGVLQATVALSDERQHFRLVAR
jgi:hypothetical protein